ncbi:MAG: nucleoside deaminase [Clostridia bacterium]|nr:nucleoside deaminase [Clostridia bacterium]
MTREEKFMRAALREAEKAASEGEVPIGCVIVKDDRIIARGRNARETKKNALCHAEIAAIHKACRKLGGWRLWQCEMYVTLEPCPMCAGAIINARLKKVFIGALDPKGGAMGSVTDLSELPFNHKPITEYGLLQEQSKQLLQDFFIRLRRKKENKTE